MAALGAGVTKHLHHLRLELGACRVRHRDTNTQDTTHKISIMLCARVENDLA